MTKQLLDIAQKMTPASIRIGLDVDILDIKANNYEYSSDKLDAGFYDNSIVAIKMKHKFIEEPFWLTLFKGAQRRNSDVSFVAAYKECLSGTQSPLYETDAINPTDLKEGFESLQEIINAFDYLWFTNDEASEYEPLVHDDCNALANHAAFVIDELYITINKKVSISSVKLDDILEVQKQLGLMKEAYETSTIEKHTKRFDALLVETGCTVIITQTEDYYGVGDEDISEDDECFDYPMFEAYIIDQDEEEIEDTTTGRFCCLNSVCDELVNYVLAVKAAREINFDDSPYTFDEKIKSVVFDPECQSGMLENHGEDFIQIKEIALKTPKKVWSVADGYDGKVHVIAGLQYGPTIHYVVSCEEFREQGETYFYGNSGHDTEEEISSYSIFAVSEDGTESFSSATSQCKAKEEVQKYTKMLNNGTFVNTTSLENIESFGYDQL